MSIMFSHLMVTDSAIEDLIGMLWMWDSLCSSRIAAQISLLWIVSGVLIKNVHKI